MRNRVLVLQALLGEIRSPLLEVSDQGVALAKLAWWGQELAPASRGNSQHPVVRAASQLDLFGDIELKYLDFQVAACANLAQSGSIVDRETLLEHCRQIGGAEIQLLGGLGGDLLEPPTGDAIGAALLLEFFARNMLSVLPGESWWVPLEDQARLGITIADVRSGRNPAALAALASDLGQDMQGLLKDVHRHEESPGIRSSQVVRVLLAVLRERAKRLSSGRSASPGRPLVSEMWTAWRAALGRQGAANGVNI